jgi:hypothetical protein
MKLNNRMFSIQYSMITITMAEVDLIKISWGPATSSGIVVLLNITLN